MAVRDDVRSLIERSDTLQEISERARLLARQLSEAVKELMSTSSPPLACASFLPSAIHPSPVATCHCAEGWVCEDHPDQPWPHDRCAEPGMPCANPDCFWWKGPTPAALETSGWTNVVRRGDHPEQWCAEGYSGEASH